MASELNNSNNRFNKSSQAGVSGMGVFVPALFVLINLLFVAWWWFATVDISRESGPMENLQLVFIFAAFIVCIYNGRMLPGEGKHFLFALSIASFYLFLREIDLRTLPVAEWIQWFGSKVPRKTIHGVALLVLFGYAAIWFREILGTVRSWSWKQGWPFYLTLLLFFIAKMTEEISHAEKNILGNFEIQHGQFWEELMELNADMMLLVAALLSSGLLALRRVKQSG